MHLNGQSKIIITKQLTQNQSYFIFEDSRAHIWLAQSDRIVRLIGNTQIEYYKNIKGLREVMLQSEFFEDDSGNIWFATSNYLVQYRYALDHFVQFQIDQEAKDYRLVEIEPDGNILLQANKSIYRFSVKGEQFEVLHTGFECIDFEVYRDEQNDLKSIIGSRWAYGPGSIRLLFEKGRVIQQDTILSNTEVFTSYKMGDNYIAHGKDGLIIWHPDNGIKYIRYSNEKMRGGYPLGNNELLVFDQTQLFSYHVTSGDFKFISKLEKTFDDIRLTSSGQFIGIGNDDIAYLIDVNQSNPFHLYKTKNPVFSMKMDKNGNNLYYSLDNNALKYVQLETGATLLVEEMGSDVFFDINTNESIAAVSSEKMIVIDPSSRKVYNILKPPTEGMEGLFRIETNKNVFFHIKGIIVANDEGEIVSKQKENTFLSQPYYSKSGYIYAVGENAIYVFEALPTSVKLLRKFNVDFYIHQFYELDEDRILLATSQGIQLLNTESGQFQDYALSNHFVNSIQIDHNRSIWAGLSTGLARMDTLGKTVYYSIDNGLPTNDFSLNCTAISDDETLYFGTNKGILYVHPDSIQDIDYTPNLVLTSLKIHGHEWADDTLNIEMTPKVELEYNQNTLTFDFVAVDYNAQNHPQYYVYLEGYDVDTTFLGDQSVTTYPNLRPGDYTFRYNACTLSGFCRDEFEEFEITITPPYWETWWFRTLGVMAIIGLIAFGISLYLRNRLREQQFAFEKQQLVLKTELQLQQERNRIADELHDELGGKLSSIKFAGKKVQRATHIDDVKKITHRVSEISTELIESMRSIIWAMDTQNDSLSSLQANIRNYAAKLGSDNDLNVSFDFEDIQDHIEVKGQIRHHLFLIVKEILNNIIKHSKANTTQILLRGNDEKIKIVISENGEGFDPDTIEKAGKGLRSIQKRIKTIGAMIKYINDDEMKIEILVPLK